ncbi:hypothetical protein Adt_39880 [Abeliophyllum distichum]|uniref:Uncharacterized protein n=1 Tax=Abeliophyllum distichum TaxID=126358 RepID=A0ABD1Q9I1_9LAMI
MRPHGCKRVCEPDIPSFDLGISTQQGTERCHVDVETGSLTENKRMTKSERQQCTKVVIFESPGNLLNDGLVFSEEDLRSIDESVKKIRTSSVKEKSKVYTC